MNLPKDIVLLSAFLGGSELGLQFSQFVLAMIATFQFTAAFDHLGFLDFLSGRGSTMMRFYGE
jgi:hypothetical protein